jgi:hypothetical protein
MKIFLKYLILIIIIFLITKPNLSYSYAILTDTYNGNISVNFWKSSNMPIKFTIDKKDPKLTDFDPNTVINFAINQWQNTGVSFVSYKIDGFTSIDVTLDAITSSNSLFYDSIYTALSNDFHSTGDNSHEVIFDNDGSIIEGLFSVDSSSVLGVGIPFTNESTGEIVDSVLFINTSVDLDKDETTKKDIIISAIVHELGHVSGLAHTNITYNVLSDKKLPTMYWSSFPNDDTQGITLELDDIAAISTLYPANNIENKYGAVEGQITKANGDGVFGISIVLINTETAEALGGISGYKTGKTGTGEFYITGIPPGEYFIFAQAIDGSSEIGNLTGDIIGGIFSNVTQDFIGEFFNDISLSFDKNKTIEIPSDVTTIEVLKGYTTKTIIIKEGTNNAPDTEITQVSGAFPLLPGGEGFTKTNAPNPTAVTPEEGGCLIAINAIYYKNFIPLLVLIFLLCLRKKTKLSIK